jgi:hypothetical protein
MKAKYQIAVFLITFIVVASCGGQKKETDKSDMQKDLTVSLYTCPMHPEVQSDVMGTCPKCGMDLVKRDASAVDSMEMNPSDSMMHD